VSVGSGVSAGELSMIPQRRRIRGEPLSDPDAIVEMLKAAMQDGIPGLRPCYERSLRANASLQGSWMLEFQVSPDGVAERIQVRGDEMSDAEMESCIAQKVQEWFFQPVVEAQPVRKTLRFRPT
jgi:hypothetical protein